MSAEKVTITKLPAGKKKDDGVATKEDIEFYKLRITELEKEVAALSHRWNDLSKAKKTVIVKKTTEYVGIGAPGAEKPETPPKPSTPPPPPPPQVIVQDTGIKDELIQELEKTKAELSSELKELLNQATVLKARNAVKTEEEESNDQLRTKLKEAKDLLGSLKIENDLTKKTLALMSI